MMHGRDDTVPDTTIEELRGEVETVLSEIALPERPESLYAPVRYVLGGGGKRIRPLLVLLAAEAYGAARHGALPVAIAVEVFHNFTLVHDDIMDRSPTRRGQPTVHVRWDASTAILAGDYMMALSYRLLAAGPAGVLPDLLSVFDEMVTRLCEGQALDKQFESTDRISLQAYLDMIDAKTGALLRASLELGGIVGGASRVEREKLRQTGLHLGRAFQIQDDLLDLVAEDERWGKSVGSDLVEGRKSFLLVRALERAEGPARSFFDRLVTDGRLDHDRIPEARRWMEEMGVLTEAREAIGAHTEAALELIQSLESDAPAKTALAEMVESMRVRLH